LPLPLLLLLPPPPLAPLAPLAPPVAYINPVINLTPAQVILLNNIIPIPPVNLVPGTRYIEYAIGHNRYHRTMPFIDINVANGLVTFGNAMGSTDVNPAVYRYYNIADLVPNGLPLPP